jgi:hypothetical protein
MSTSESERSPNGDRYSPSMSKKGAPAVSIFYTPEVEPLVPSTLTPSPSPSPSPCSLPAVTLVGIKYR